MNYVTIYRQIQQKLEADKCTTQTQKIYILSLVLEVLQNELSKDTDVLIEDVKKLKDKTAQSVIALDTLLNQSKS